VAVPVNGGLTSIGGLGAAMGTRGYGAATAGGRRGYGTVTIRHFPKHLLRKAGEPPRPPIPESVREDLEAYNKYDMDPQVCPTPRD
jgi:hypothetical protein